MEEPTPEPRGTIDRPQLKIYTGVLGRRARLGIGLAAIIGDQVIRSTFKIVGYNKQINIYLTQLGAIHEAITVAIELLNSYPALQRILGVTIYTNSQTALKSVCVPHHQSGQYLIIEIVGQIRKLQEAGFHMRIIWLPTHTERRGAQLAKEAAAHATEEDWPFYPPNWADKQLKSSAWRWRRESLQSVRRQQFERASGGNYTKAIDFALPGKHTIKLYDQLTRRQATVLAQLRTGHARVNWYLHRIGKVSNNICECLESPETVKHLLFRCPLWEGIRTEMKSVMGRRYGDLSYALGGKTLADQENRWTPNLEVVKTTIQFAMRTKRLETDRNMHRDD